MQATLEREVFEEGDGPSVEEEKVRGHEELEDLSRIPTRCEEKLSLGLGWARDGMRAASISGRQGGFSMARAPDDRGVGQHG